MGWHRSAARVAEGSTHALMPSVCSHGQRQCQWSGCRSSFGTQLPAIRDRVARESWEALARSEDSAPLIQKRQAALPLAVQCRGIVADRQRLPVAVRARTLIDEHM